MKDEARGNTVSPSVKEETWIPELNLELTVPGTKKTIVQTLKVIRRKEPVMTNDNDVLRSTEKYQGRLNPFYLIQRMQAKFICEFDSIKYFPFGIQKCLMRIGLRGVGKLINFRMTRENLTFKKEYYSDEIEQYTVTNWTVEEADNKSNINIVLHMKRSIHSIVMVTYLPTILMNIINQAVVYI